MARRVLMRSVAIVLIAAATGFTALAVSGSNSGDAAFPGANGRIAYAYGEGYGYGGGSIWSANADGSSPTQLTSGSYDRSPAYSANGGRIAFERESGVAVMNADGSAVTQLLDGNYSSSSKTAWESEYKNPEKPSEEIPFVKITTYTEKWHTFNSPSFSPDGSELAVGESRGEWVFTVTCEVEEAEGSTCTFGYEGGYFHYEEECVDCGARIVAVDSSTGATFSDVTSFVKGVGDYEPSYSTDGKIAFSRWTEPSSYSIFVVDSLGSAPRRVTSGNEDYAPDFSPDGSRIAFSHDGELALVGAGGGSVTLLPVPAPAGAFGAFSESPSFSPDGSRIAFEHTVYPKIGKTERGVFTIGADGSGLAKVIEGGTSPSWQPLSVPAPPPVQPAPKPPKARSPKGKVRLNKKSRAKVGSIECGSSPCSLKIFVAKLKVGKKVCRVKATAAGRLSPGKVTKVQVRVSGKCLAALKRAGKGLLSVKVRVTDAVGKHTLSLRATLTPPKGHRHGTHKRHRHKAHR